MYSKGGVSGDFGISSFKQLPHVYAWKVLQKISAQIQNLNYSYTVHYSGEKKNTPYFNSFQCGAALYSAQNLTITFCTFCTWVDRFRSARSAVAAPGLLKKVSEVLVFWSFCKQITITYVSNLVGHAVLPRQSSMANKIWKELFL